MLAKLCVKTGEFFSIENPEHSFIWHIKQFLDLLQMDGVHEIVGDQCCFGAASVKPTRWRTNEPWLHHLARRCPGEPHHPTRRTLREYDNVG